MNAQQGRPAEGPVPIRPRNSRFVMAALVLVLAVAACSGGDDAADPAPEGGGTPTTEAVSAGSITPSVTAAAPTTQAEAGSSGSEIEIAPCSLLSTAEVEAATGFVVTETVEDVSTPPIASCDYDAEQGSLSVIIFTYPDAAAALDFMRDVIEMNDYEEIEGLGDIAYNAQPVGDISVLSGAIEVSVNVLGFDLDDQQEFDFARSLAEIVLPRLP